MKKLLMLLLTVAMLTGCGVADRNDIMNLLSAPKPSEREGQIIAAVNDYLGNDVVLKYPKTGENVSPIQFADIDGDGREDAVVLYSDSATGLFARMAVLKQTQKGWEVCFDTEGYGPEVFSISFEHITEKRPREIAVCYTFADSRDKILSLYFMKDGRISQEKNLPCQDYAIFDATGDGISDIVLVGVNAENQRTQIKLLSTHDNSDNLTTVANSRINVRNAEVTNIAFSKSRFGGKDNIIIDYTDRYNKVYTEAFVYENGGFDRTLKPDTVQKFWHFDYELNSRDIDGDGYWETPTIIDDGTGRKYNLKQMEWTCFLLKEPQRKYYGVCEALSGIFFPLPDEWQNRITLNYNESDRSWQVKRATDNQTIVDFRLVPAVDRENSEDERIIVGKGTVQVKITFDEAVNSRQREYISTGLTDIR